MKPTRAVAPIVLILGLAVAALLAPKVVPSLFDKRTVEAHESADASAKVEQAVAKERAGRLRADGIIAASLAQMNRAWGELDDSPQKTFLSREYQFIDPLLGVPDVAAMQASYERRIAIMQGKTELTDKLYKEGNAKNADLIAKNAKLETRLQASFAGRREVDTKLAESAAYAQGKDTAITVLVALVVVIGAAYLWLRHWMRGNTVGFDALAEARAMVMKGEKDVENAFDGIVDRVHWPKMAKLVDTYFTAKDARVKTGLRVTP